jgi:hypothetical protein
MYFSVGLLGQHKASGVGFYGLLRDLKLTHYRRVTTPWRGSALPPPGESLLPSGPRTSALRRTG